MGAGLRDRMLRDLLALFGLVLGALCAASVPRSFIRLLECVFSFCPCRFGASLTIPSLFLAHGGAQLGGVRVNFGLRSHLRGLAVVFRGCRGAGGRSIRALLCLDFRLFSGGTGVCGILREFGRRSSVFGSLVYCHRSVLRLHCSNMRLLFGKIHFLLGFIPVGCGKRELGCGLVLVRQSVLAQITGLLGCYRCLLGSFLCLFARCFSKVRRLCHRDGSSSGL